MKGSIKKNSSEQLKNQEKKKAPLTSKVILFLHHPIIYPVILQSAEQNINTLPKSNV